MHLVDDQDREDEHEEEIPEPPDGLAAAGAALWEDVTCDYGLAPTELALLEAACRTADEIDRLETSLAAAEVVVVGSKGQPRPNPLLAELRGHRTLLQRLLGSIGLEDADAASGHEAAERSSAGRKLAAQRWHKRGHRGVA